MKDASKIAMLIGLVALILVVLNLPSSFNFGFHFGALRGILPWILLSVAFWFMYGGRRCGRNCRSGDGDKKTV